MFYLTTKNKEDCYGCGACQLVCPNQSITISNDNEGFLYPERSASNCGNCNYCERVCPNLNKEKIQWKEGQPRAYLGIHKEDKTLQNSSSGGVFSGVAQVFCTDDYRVFGAQFGEGLKVEHTHISHLSQMTKLRKSKYVFSDMGNSYREARDFLEVGMKVLFTGTPCQIAGLKLYLGKAYEHLLSVDVICHGAPSQKVFDSYIKFLESKHKGKVKSFSFRHKTYSWLKGWNSKNVKYSIGKESFIISPTEDPYLRGYHKGLFYRPSCYQCKYANPQRISDITMADFWGVDELFPKIDVHKGCSVLISNTEKGQEWMDRLEESMTLEKVELSDVIKRNSQLREPAKKHHKREVFFSNLGKQDFESVVNLCIPKERITIRKIVVKFVPYKMKRIIKRLKKYNKTK